MSANTHAIKGCCKALIGTSANNRGLTALRFSMLSDVADLQLSSLSNP